MLKLFEQTFFKISQIDFFLITIASFTLLYFSFAATAYFIFNKKNLFKKFQTKNFRTNQIKTEIKRSFVSILMFGLLSFVQFHFLHSGFFKIKFQFDLIIFIGEAFVLFLWNEVYFYVIHRLFHLKAFYKYHTDHHYSHVPSPFSAYSFHWSEGLILGAVMPVIMCFYDFQVFSLLTLPLMSIAMNVLGHSNVDFFPSKNINHLLSFSKRHSLHHKIPHSNYGFFLPYLDLIFKTDGEDYEAS